MRGKGLGENRARDGVESISEHNLAENRASVFCHASV